MVWLRSYSSGGRLVLKAWFKEQPAGHWVVFKTTISEVALFSMAYA
jgi:hypothetical protein